MTRHLIEDGPVFRVEHCESCPVPGYLIVAPTDPATSLSQLSATAQRELGPALARATALIEQVIDPLNVYCGRFGELHRAVHFHLFPRTDWITREFRAQVGEGGAIDGPRLLAWARQTFHAGTSRPIPPPGVEQVVDRMRTIANTGQTIVR